MAPRSRLAVGVDIVVRKLMWHTLSRQMPLYLVSEYPKSGGTWFAEMLSEYLEVPFPRNRLPKLQSCVMHGHHLYSPSFYNAFCVLRDGRDAMVSAYFHMLFENERNHPGMVRRLRAAVPFDDYEDVHKNLPLFVEHMFTRYTGPMRFTWSEFVRSWVDKPVEIVRYEELLADSAGRLGQALTRVLGVEPDTVRLGEIARKYSFENVAKRRKGTENTRSFLRKGVAGDWKEKFTPEARTMFARYAGEELILAGYEQDHAWVHEAGLERVGPTRVEG